MARESRALIIVHGHHTIRAGYGIHELFSLPTVELTARVALTEDYLEQHGLLDPHAAAAGNTRNTGHKPSADDYLVGTAIDEAVRAGKALRYYWPMQPHMQVRDWQAMLALWRHLLFHATTLGLRRSSNTSVTLLALPAPLSREQHACISSLWFEQLNCPGLALVESPLLAAYATAALSATVVDIGAAASVVTPVADCLVQHNAIVRCPVGARHCTLWLAHLLRQDASLVQALGALSEHHATAASAAVPSSAAATPPRNEQDERLHELLVELAEMLVHEGHINGLDDDAAGGGGGKFSSSSIGGSGAGAAAGVEEEPELDVAAMLVQGKEKELIEEQERRKKALQDAIAGKASAADVAAAITGEAGQAGGSTDPKAVLVSFKGLRLKVGPSRFRYAEPLFCPDVLRGVRGIQQESDAHSASLSGAGPVLGDPVLNNTSTTPSLSSSLPTAAQSHHPTADALATAPSLPECIHAAIAQVPDLERRPALWDALVVTGAPTRTRGLAASITRHCAPFIVGGGGAVGGGAADQSGGVAGFGAPAPGAGAGAAAAIIPDEPNQLQPRNVRALKVPDYFVNFKDRTDLAPFLGATIYAKLIFSDAAARSYVTKANHNERGPTAAFSITA
ncbi:hypothetical protein K437DRAFT_239486 [Tilletiaria anomala UBC 951]|uniref:Actin-like ATPase domain-containing protein n=1 Tax=Tilletiaria anomala (strain ATCC 24038 / CBS 436.72 / UBC 951) TaxID=1037660 RepID=A0A066VLK6_TILAU|nr:uncharacterized protein K437DRAFT_239486 [Tilletiaria anomala UBC 951]KDN39450.1 hypothetical protein K437DRAFT_239486 [Tilletiaria anomala UBC 951]